MNDLTSRHGRLLLSLATLALLLGATACGEVPPVSRTTPSATAVATAGSTPTTSVDSYLKAWPPPPACPASAGDAPICTVNIPAGGSGGTLTASTTEHILFRIGWADPTQQSCDAYASNTTTTITLDGQTVAPVSVSCQFVATAFGGCSNQWRFDIRYLSAPLPAGSHTAVGTVSYNAPVPGAPGCTAVATEDSTPAGRHQSFQKTVVVS